MRFLHIQESFKLRIYSLFQLPWLETGLVAVSLVVLALIGFTGHQLSELLFPDIVETVYADPSCNLHTDFCGAEFTNGAEIHFSISPKPVRMLEPLALRVVATGVDAQKVSVDFVGLNEYMGFNRPVLSEQASGAFVGKALLQICTVDLMQWETRVLLESADGVREAVFRFNTSRDLALRKAL